MYSLNSDTRTINCGAIWIIAMRNSALNLGYFTRCGNVNKYMQLAIIKATANRAMRYDELIFPLHNKFNRFVVNHRYH